jgi:hypothetical protein
LGPALLGLPAEEAQEGALRAPQPRCAPAAAIAELERNERIHEDIVRYLTVKIEAIDPEPSIVMQVKSSRDDRRRDRP